MTKVHRPANPKQKCYKKPCGNVGYPNAYLGERSVYACPPHRKKR